jgi:flagellar basal body rod protein FlgC
LGVGFDLAGVMKTAQNMVMTGRDMQGVTYENLRKESVSGYKAQIPFLEFRASPPGIQARLLTLPHVFVRWGHLLDLKGTRKRICDNTARLHSLRPHLCLSNQDPGVVICSKQENKTPCNEIFQPGNPNADDNGMVPGSNVDNTKELVRAALAGQRVSTGLALYQKSWDLRTRVVDVVSR